MSKEFKSTCPDCGKPITTKDGKVPKHKIGFNRDGRVVKMLCPGVGKRPN